VHPVTERVLAERWAALPPGVRTEQQVLGRHAVGCEGTHGVFPKCDLTCSPCYHSKDANKVRVDGAHTIAQVEAQMRLLEQSRGPRAHAQLIGGEVSLLDPDDHAAALAAMRAHGREPMSMSHGDFTAAYLRAVALDETGKPRFGRLSFAGHFDSLMRGRTGIPRPRSEVDLNPFRARFVEMFRDLRRDHGVRSFLAHNMTITPANLDQVEHVVADVSAMGFSMLSFQPAAHVGDERRWTGGDYRTVGIDDVWDRLEAGLGQRIAWQALQFGDPRCNRTAFGLRVDGRWVPMFDPDSEADLIARDRALAHFGGVNFGGSPALVLAVKVLRVLVRHPGDVTVAVAWVRRLVERSGGVRHVSSTWCLGGVTPMTYVVHNFMDAADVAPAWKLMQDGQVAIDPATRVAQERLSACTYAMAHPETGELVPACVQHSVLDPGENQRLRRLLPLTVVESETTVRSMSSEHVDQSLPSVDHPASPDGPRRPGLLIFDVNETLSDMSPMARRFEDVGAPATLSTSWFAGLLRDGFALTAVEASDSFAHVAAESLKGSLHGLPLDRSIEEAVSHIMDGFAGLPVHADVPDGIRALGGLGIRLVTLSNGSASVAEALFDRAGIREHFERLLTVEDAGRWKPAPEAYSYALQECGVDPEEVMLVAVHPWDIDGASRAGLAAAWVNRPGGPYPEYFRAPDLRAVSLTDLADQLC